MPFGGESYWSLRLSLVLSHIPPLGQAYAQQTRCTLCLRPRSELRYDQHILKHFRFRLGRDNHLRKVLRSTCNCMESVSCQVSTTGNRRLLGSVDVKVTSWTVSQSTTVRAVHFGRLYEPVFILVACSTFAASMTMKQEDPIRLFVSEAFHQAQGSMNGLLAGQWGGLRCLHFALPRATRHRPRKFHRVSCFGAVPTAPPCPRDPEGPSLLTAPTIKSSTRYC